MKSILTPITLFTFVFNVFASPFGLLDYTLCIEQNGENHTERAINANCCSPVFISTSKENASVFISNKEGNHFGCQNCTDVFISQFEYLTRSIEHDLSCYAPLISYLELELKVNNIRQIKDSYLKLPILNSSFRKSTVLII